jgi:hypothetical protein
MDDEFDPEQWLAKHPTLTQDRSHPQPLVQPRS